MRNALALAALFAAAPAFAAETPVVVQKTLQADYEARDRAVTGKNIDATLAQYAPDFVGVSRTGKTHGLKDERTDFLRTFALPAQSGGTQSAIQKLTLMKAGAEADVTLHRHGRLTLIDPQTHGSRVVILDGIYQDVWAKRAAVWLLTREQEISVKVTVNGEPL